MPPWKAPSRWWCRRCNHALAGPCSCFCLFTLASQLPAVPCSYSSSATLSLGSWRSSWSWTPVHVWKTSWSHLLLSLNFACGSCVFGSVTDWWQMSIQSSYPWWSETNQATLWGHSICVRGHTAGPTTYWRPFCPFLLALSSPFSSFCSLSCPLFLCLCSCLLATQTQSKASTWSPWWGWIPAAAPLAACAVCSLWWLACE